MQTYNKTDEEVRKLRRTPQTVNPVEIQCQKLLNSNLMLNMFVCFNINFAKHAICVIFIFTCIDTMASIF